MNGNGFNDIGLASLMPPEHQPRLRMLTQAQLLRGEEVVQKLKAELSRLRALPRTGAEHPVKDCYTAEMDDAAHKSQVHKDGTLQELRTQLDSAARRALFRAPCLGSVKIGL